MKVFNIPTFIHTLGSYKAPFHLDHGTLASREKEEKKKQFTENYLGKRYFF